MRVDHFARPAGRLPFRVQAFQPVTEGHRFRAPLLDGGELHPQRPLLRQQHHSSPRRQLPGIGPHPVDVDLAGFETGCVAAADVHQRDARATGIGQGAVRQAQRVRAAPAVDLDIAQAVAVAQLHHRDGVDLALAPARMVGQQEVHQPVVAGHPEPAVVVQLQAVHRPERQALRGAVHAHVVAFDPHQAREIAGEPEDARFALGDRRDTGHPVAR